jgi:micrococcal nuclease
VILPDGRNLNRELVKAGLAWSYRQYARHDRELERLEAEARKAKRGLWADSNPIPPWEWRRSQRKSTRRSAAVLRRGEARNSGRWRR